jgi:hypothetical protein
LTLGPVFHGMATISTASGQDEHNWSIAHGHDPLY